MFIDKLIVFKPGTVQHARFCILIVARVSEKHVFENSRYILRVHSSIWTMLVGEERLCVVCVEVLRPSQQLWSCRAGQLPINTVPGQA